MSKLINSELNRILNKISADQEMAVEIAFESEKSAENFATLANQVIFDTTLDLEQGYEDITETLRNYAAEHPNMNMQATGSRVNAYFDGNLIQDINNCGKGLGIKEIQLVHNVFGKE